MLKEQESEASLSTQVIPHYEPNDQFLEHVKSKCNLNWEEPPKRPSEIFKEYISLLQNDNVKITRIEIICHDARP